MELSKEDGEGGARGEEAQRARGGQSKESGHLSSWTPNVNASEFVPSAGVVDKQLLPLATFTPDTVYMIGYWTPTAPTMPAVPAAEQPCTDRSAISGSTTVDPAAYGHEFDSLQLSDSTDPNVVMGSGVAIDSDLTNPGVGGFIGYPGNTMSLCTNAHPGWASVHSQMNESGNAAPAFVPSSKFCGAHPGWVFKSGEHGVGYYSEPLKPRSRKARARTRAAAVREHESEPGGQGNVTKVVDASSKQVIAACGNGDVGNTLLQQAENLSSRVQEWPVVDSSRAIPGGKKEDNDGKVGRHGAKRKTKTRDGNRLELANGVERTTADRIQSASAAPALAPTPSSWADHIRSRQRQPSSDVQERRSHDVAPTPERWMPRNHKVTPRVIHDAAVDKADHAVTVPPLLDECASGPSDAVPSAPRQPPGDSPSCAHHQATRPSWASAVSHASMQPSGSSPAERASSGKRETAYGGATTQALAMYIQSAAVNLSADESEQDGHGVRASQKGVETSRTEKAPMLGAWARRLPAVTSPALGGEHISNVNSKLISAPKGALSGMAEERNLPSSSQRGPATACAAMASVADAEGHLLGSNAEQSLGEKRQGPLVGWVSASKNGSKSANEGGGRASSSIVDDRKTLHWSAQGAKVTGSVRGSSTGAPLPNPPGSKPKPQKSVSLFDFLDLAKPDRLAPSTTAKGPILSARGAHGGRSLSAPRAREVAAEGSGSAGGGVVGLGRTQRRGKEKEGPRKIRLSKMKKTILTELLEKHGVSHLGVEPAPSVGAPLRLPEFNELESRAKARIAEEDLKSGKASESATKALDAAEEMAGRDSTVIGPQESAPKDEESGDGPLPKDGTSQQVSTGSSAQLKRPPAAVANSFLVREYVDQIVAPCINDATKALLAEVQRFQVSAGARLARREILAEADLLC